MSAGDTVRTWCPWCGVGLDFGEPDLVLAVHLNQLDECPYVTGLLNNPRYMYGTEPVPLPEVVWNRKY